jgi:hypothetical protein
MKRDSERELKSRQKQGRDAHCSLSAPEICGGEIDDFVAPPIASINTCRPASDVFGDSPLIDPLGVGGTWITQQGKR